MAQGTDMTIRVFRCSDCGHKMRLTGTTCGYCHTEKLLYQRLGFYLAILAGLAVAAVFAVVIA
jgi:hypothetical protein